MQIVIDIPEHIKILTEKYNCYGKQAEKIIWNAIKDGTPLSECQAEDCIDRDMAIKEINKVFADYIPLLIGKYEEIPLKCGKAIKNMPSVYPKSDESVLHKVAKEELQALVKDSMEHEKSVLEDIKAELLNRSFSITNPYDTYEYINVVAIEVIEKVINKHISGK